MARQPGVRARPRTSAAGRLEQLRRDRLALLRRTLAAEGYDGTVRLVQEDGHFAIMLSPETGMDERTLWQDLSRDLSEPGDVLLEQARQLADLAMIAQRRATAILAAGGDLADPPSWSYLGHPVARGAYAAMGYDLADFRPRRAAPSGGSSMGMTVVDFRIRHAAMRVVRDGLTIVIDADQDVARVRLLGGKWPETLVDAMPGRAVGDILGLAGLERGTRAGDAPIGTAWAEGDGIGLTVACRLEPMGIVPNGIDVGFLEEWFERHYR